jgi:hypothetical protein
MNVFLMCYDKCDHYFGHCPSHCDVLCIYWQEQCVGKWAYLHHQEYTWMLFLRDFTRDSADRSSFWNTFEKTQDSGQCPK